MLSQNPKGFDGSVKTAAPNAAMTSLFQYEHHWRGIGEPER
jgi:hypothetical protein